jgi:hypothetical protein
VKRKISDRSLYRFRGCYHKLKTYKKVEKNMRRLEIKLSEVALTNKFLAS